MDPDGARDAARRYLVEVLEHPAYDNLNYPS